MKLLPKTPRAPLEIELVAEIRAALSREPGVMVVRNNTGRLRDAHGRMISYGLGIGSPDLVGVVAMGPALREDGSRRVHVGRMLALEVKRPEMRGRVSAEQLAWLTAWSHCGAACAVVTSVDEALGVLRRARAGEAISVTP